MAVRKFMKPKAAVAFSRKLCFNSRNAVPCLQARAFNLRGNLISDVTVRASIQRGSLLAGERFSTWPALSCAVMGYHVQLGTA